ncbi:hypothetical protein DID73_00740 [Candidatus Marinamargulisbacteria bacterium SCGC AG-343-K17]|nr:hypothetical protein DID73_00740 [Candidatus Marinamargulisbacteria bacterium SCGC AG-343-K17]
MQLSRSLYIVSPRYDWLGFIGAPLIALVIGWGVSRRFIPDQYVQVGHYSGYFWDMMVLILMTQCHLFITVVRAYGNSVIFRAFKWRLLLVPPMLFAVGYFSQYFLILQLVINTWWDAYHSACQTFGFTRLYDSKAGDHSLTMRRLDRILSVLIYMGPIIGGATLIEHLGTFGHFSLVGLFFLADVPAVAGTYSFYLLMVVGGFSLIFLPYYVFRSIQHSKQHPVSILKVLMLVITAVVSLLAWGFNSFGMAFIIANFFHAWQYYAMLFWSEKKALMTRFKRFRLGPFGVFFLFSVISIGFAFFLLFVINPKEASRAGLCFLATVATCHFWFDGFIWSVRKEHV